MRTLAFLVILFLPAAASANSCKGASSLRCENILADRFNLSRISNLKMLKRFVERGRLVRVPDSDKRYHLDEHLGEHDAANREFYKYARPDTRDFIERLGEAFRERFGRSIKITSLVRTREYQKRLRKNPNAAPVWGDKSSTHLTGATFDLSFREMSDAEIAWTWDYLRREMRRGHLYAIKEKYGGCFHTMVFPVRKRR